MLTTTRATECIEEIDLIWKEWKLNIEPSSPFSVWETGDRECNKDPPFFSDNSGSWHQIP